MSKKIILCSLYMLCAICIEMATFIHAEMGLFPQYPFFTIAFIFSIAMILFVIPWYYLSFGLAGFLLVLQTVLGFTNINIYLIINDVFSMDMLKTATEGGEMNMMAYVNFYAITFFITPLLIFFVGAIATAKLIKNPHIPFTANLAFAFSVIIFLSSAIIPTIYNIQLKYLYVDTTSGDVLTANDKELYKSMGSKANFFRKFGTFPMYYRNVICGQSFGDKDIASVDDCLNYFNDATYFDETDYFNIANGDNLLIIQLESISDFFLSEKYTPALWDLKQKSIDFTNNHAKGYTEITRSSVILGSLPYNGSLIGDKMSGWDEKDDFFDFSLPNQLLNNGFKTAEYFAPEAASFRNNYKTFKRFGFQKVNRLPYEPLETDYNYIDYPSEMEKYFSSKWTPQYYNKKWRFPEEWYYKLAVDDILPKSGERFFSFVNTVNAHGPYGKDISPYHSEIKNNEIDDKDFDWMDKKTYSLFKNALAMVIGVDRGIKFLIDELEARGLSDNTTIMIYADHNAYLDDLSWRVLDIKKRDNNPEVYKVPAFIVTPGLTERIEVTKFTTYYDFPVTLFQLFGIKVNSKLYFGYDALDDNYESIHKCRAGGIYNDLFFTPDGIDKYWESKDATREDWIKFQKEAKRLQDIMPYFNRLYTKDRLAITCF